MAYARYTAEERKRLKALADEIEQAIPWKRTPQGFKYWLGVWNEVNRLRTYKRTKWRPPRPKKRVLTPQESE